MIEVETETWILTMTHPGLHGQPMEESEAVTGLSHSQIQGHPLWAPESLTTYRMPSSPFSASPLVLRNKHHWPSSQLRRLRPRGVTMCRLSTADEGQSSLVACVTAEQFLFFPPDHPQPPVSSCLSSLTHSPTLGLRHHRDSVGDRSCSQAHLQHIREALSPSPDLR